MGAYNRLKLEIKAESLSIAKQTNATDPERNFISTSLNTESGH
jgi:hypothetical protein